MQFVLNAFFRALGFAVKVPCAPKWFDFEFPIIKTTKLLVETRLVREQSEFTHSDSLVAAGHL